MEMIFVGWVLGLIPFLLGYFIGWFSAKGSLTEKVKQILKTRRPEDTSGPVKSLTPEQLEKKTSHQLWEKYMG